MENSKFIKLTTVDPRTRDDDPIINKVRKLLKTNYCSTINLTLWKKKPLEEYKDCNSFNEIFINIDEIAQIWSRPHAVLIVKSERRYKVIHVHNIRVKTGDYRGINGIDHDMYITDESYQNLISKLGLI